MPKKRRKYPLEFKLEAVRLVQEEGLTYAQVGRDLQIDRSLVRAWVKAAEEGGLQPAGPSRAPETDLEAEVRRLRRENARLREEKDILKKAAAFFAKESQ